MFTTVRSVTYHALEDEYLCVCVCDSRPRCNETDMTPGSGCVNWCETGGINMFGQRLKYDR